MAKDLAERVAALEAKLGMTEQPKQEPKTLVAEIAELEKRITAMAGDEESSEEAKKECTASETEPGVEDDITQDRFTEVENLEHGTELTTDDSTHDIMASEEPIVRLKRASARLDKVADYLEKNGRTALALRIDKIADAIDARINGGQK